MAKIIEATVAVAGPPGSLSGRPVPDGGAEYQHVAWLGGAPTNVTPPAIHSAWFASLQGGLTAAAGNTYIINRGTYSISAPLTPAANTTIIIEPGTIIDQTTKYTPVFDCLDVDDVVIHCNSALFRWTGSRLYTFAGGSVRGDDPYSYGAGIWSNGNRNRFHDVRAFGFTCGVNLSSWNGTTLANYAKTDNVVDGVIVDTVDFGVLAGGQVNPTIRNVRGTYATQSGASGQGHLVYITNTGLTRGLSLDACAARNGSAGGPPFQIKGVTGGHATNLQADTCPGLVTLATNTNLRVTARAINDLGQAENGSVYFIDPNSSGVSVDATIHAADTSTGYRLAYIDGKDNTVRLSGRVRQTLDTENYAIVLNGTRNTVELDLANLQDNGADFTVGRRGVLVDTAAVDPKVRIGTLRNFRAGVDSTGAAARVTIIAEGGRVVPAGAYRQPFHLLKNTTDILHRDGVATASITAASQTVNVDDTIRRTLHINATTTNAFTVGVPLGHGWVPMGHRLTYTIQNSSGGAMGAITWSAHVFASTWTNPANGARKSIEFVWDGANYTEIGRTA